MIHNFRNYIPTHELKTDEGKTIELSVLTHYYNGIMRRAFPILEHPYLWNI